MSKELTKIDLWSEVVRPSILEQYRGITLTDEQVAEWVCNNRWQACLKSIVDKVQYLDNAACELPTFLDISAMPVGKQLDWIVGLTNKKRKEGESDEALFSRFIAGLGRGKAGSVPVLIESVKRLSKDADPVYFEEVDATFFVTSFRGKQLSRAQVSLLSPAGVLGVPGAAIQFADGSFMGDAEGKIFLAVADDENIEPEPGPVPDKIVIGGLPYRVGEMPDGRVWMLENLQLDVPDSWFYDNDESTYGRTGKNYGRLYTWNAAMSIVVPGWHVPSRAEWEQLINSVGGQRECKKLTSASFGGTDDFGFNALFGGMRGDDGDFLYVGQEANFISSSETGSRYCDNMCLNEYYFYADDYSKSYACSVRLVKDA